MTASMSFIVVILVYSLLYLVPVVILYLVIFFAIKRSFALAVKNAMSDADNWRLDWFARSGWAVA